MGPSVAGRICRAPYLKSAIMNRYPVWKYAILVITLLVAAFYPAQFLRRGAGGAGVSAGKATIRSMPAVCRVEAALQAAGVTPGPVTLGRHSVGAL